MLAVDALGGAADTLPSTLSDDPILVGAAVLTILALLLFSFGLLRFRQSKAERFQATIAKLDSVAVLMHPDPDPDAMGSALAAKTIAEAAETETTIYYTGQIRRPENRAFQAIIDVDFERLDHAKDLAGEAVVLVDHNEPRGFGGATGVEPHAVVDHHPGGGTGTEFSDVRTDSGACVTIFIEYLRELGWQPYDESDNEDRPDKPLPSDLTTGLLYGILSDTNYLSSGCSDSEFEAMSYLYHAVDEDMLNRIANPQVDHEVLDVKARAISKRDVRNAFAVSDVGTVSNGDAVAEAAEELLRLEGVTAVVVIADKDGSLEMSGRSNDDRVHMGNALETAVEDIPMANAGGHSRMGGGTLSLEHLEERPPDNLLTGADGGTELTRERFRERLFDVMRGDI